MTEPNVYDQEDAIMELYEIIRILEARVVELETAARRLSARGREGSARPLPEDAWYWEHG